jgi:hypothetical protein
MPKHGSDFLLSYDTETFGLQKSQQIFMEAVDVFINTFQIFLPRHVSANGCHLQGIVGAL